MSEYTYKTGLSSILKNYSSANREKLKAEAINKVRFELPKEKGLLFVVGELLNNDNFLQYKEFLDFISFGEITDEVLFRILSDGRQVLNSLNPEIFSTFIDKLTAIDWSGRNSKLLEYYKEFVVDILVAHNRYANIIVKNLIQCWFPKKEQKSEWKDGVPDKNLMRRLDNIHDLIHRLLNVMPMLYGVVADHLEQRFPYFKEPAHVCAGYIYNCLWLLRYRPDFLNVVIETIVINLLKMDVHAPRQEIEDAEDESKLEEDIANEAIFEIEGYNDGSDPSFTMVHEVAEVLDLCLKKMLEFSKEIYDSSNTIGSSAKWKNLNFNEYFAALLRVFEKVLLSSHNTHHVQFIMFYCCSFKSILVNKYVHFLWGKIINPNESAPIRQASVGYLASLLSRSKFIPLSVIKNYLLEMCNWAHQYIERTDSIRSNISLKANIVFYAVCQAIFYVIAFRSKDLTKDKSSLLFLQSLHLSALVTCSFNPLRVCLPAVSTAFASVTRTYQLAYCHTILERNARRKLATVYSNELISPEECLDTFFPFDPCLLKKSGHFITPIYLQYQANEAEETESELIETSNKMSRRKRGDSEMENDDDDFITMDKKFRHELSKSHEKDAQFTYGLSPGFHF